MWKKQTLWNPLLNIFIYDQLMRVNKWFSCLGKPNSHYFMLVVHTGVCVCVCVTCLWLVFSPCHSCHLWNNVGDFQLTSALDGCLIGAHTHLWSYRCDITVISPPLSLSPRVAFDLQLLLCLTKVCSIFSTHRHNEIYSASSFAYFVSILWFKFLAFLSWGVCVFS